MRIIAVFRCDLPTTLKYKLTKNLVDWVSRRFPVRRAIRLKTQTPTHRYSVIDIQLSI